MSAGYSRDADGGVWCDADCRANSTSCTISFCLDFAAEELGPAPEDAA